MTKLENIQKAKSKIKLGFWLGVFCFVMTTLTGILKFQASGHMIYMLDSALIGTFLASIYNKKYWAHISLCTYWSMDILYRFNDISAVTFIVKILFLYVFITAARSAKLLNELEK